MRKRFRKNVLIVYLILSGAIIGLDQLVKFYISSNFQLGQEQTLIPGFLSFYYLHNTGGAFSLLEGKMWFFFLITLVALIAAIYFLVKNLHNSKWLTIGISLFLAGAVGNFIDRMYQGFVVDMFRFDFIDFAIFNVADVSLVAGVICLFIYMILDERKSGKKKK
jgi:signal peptidase II